MRSDVTLKGAIVLLSILGMAAPRVARADDSNGSQWVDVTGEAAIVSNNKVAAKHAARREALRQAVEQVAGTIVSGISESKNYMSVRDEIVSQGAGFVRKYSVTKTVCSDGTCKVTVHALVAKGALKHKLAQLGLLVQQRGYPRVIVLLSEQNDQAAGPSQWWGGGAGARSQVAENELVTYLNKTVDTSKAECNPKDAKHQKRYWYDNDACWQDLPSNLRFRFVDYTSLVTNPVVREAGGKKLSDSAAVSIAKLTDAEVAIVGTASAKVQGKMDTATADQPMYFCSGTISLRAISVASGKVLGTASAHLQLMNVSKSVGNQAALEQVTRKVVPKLQAAIADAWQNEQNAGRWVKLEVNGLASWSELTKFKSLLQSGLSGVQAVQQRRMNGKSALLELHTTSSAEELATELSSRPLGKFSVTVTKVTPDVVGLTLSR